MMKGRILILGASSDIGVCLIEELLKNKKLEIYAHGFLKTDVLKNLTIKNKDYQK